MPDEGFLRRWSRRKTESRLGQEAPAEPLQPLPEPEDRPQPAVAAAPADAREADAADAVDAAAALPLPTMDDVARLTRDSDYSAFVARGVDMAVRRSALKKLFADPHFNAMDGLDIYIDDYSKPSPLSETMLASLRHAARLFERVAGEEVAAPAQDDVVAAAAAAVPEQAVDSASGGDPQDQQTPTTPPETETR